MTKNCPVLYLIGFCLCVTGVHSACQMVLNSGSPSVTSPANTINECWELCYNQTTHPCEAATYTASTKNCVRYTGVSGTSTGVKEYSKTVKSCQRFAIACNLKEVPWKAVASRNGSAARTEAMCRDECLSDWSCVVAVYTVSGGVCRWYDADGVIRTSPASGTSVIEWHCTTVVWIWIVIGLGAVFLVILVIICLCCLCRRRGGDGDKSHNVKNMNDGEDDVDGVAQKPATKTPEIKKIDKAMKSHSVPMPVNSLFEKMYYHAAVHYVDGASEHLPDGLKSKMIPTLENLADVICWSYFNERKPFKLDKVLYTDSATDSKRINKKSNHVDYDIDYVLLLDGISFNTEQLQYPFGPSSPYVTLPIGGDMGGIWRSFLDTGHLSPYRLKEQLYKNLKQGYVPLCVGCSRVDGAYLVGISESPAVTLFEQRIDSSIGNGVLKVTPTQVPYRTSVPRSQYDLAIDLVIAVRCNGWPLASNEWVNRQRNYDWPTKSLVEDILREGVYMVPRSPSPNQPLCFQLSFSTAEKLLSDSLNRTHQQVYRCAKAVLNKSVKDEENDLLESSIPFSYCLKNVMFWECEELAPSLWNRGDRMPERLIRLLTRLEQCFKQRNCPHYFIPSHNLLGENISERECQRAAEVVGRIAKDMVFIYGALHEERQSSFINNCGANVDGYRFRWAKQKIEKKIRDALASSSAMYESGEESTSLLGQQKKSYGTDPVA